MLLILLAGLFVPVRYRLIVSHGDETTANGTVTWLLHIVRGKFSFEGKKKRIWIRIFGLLVYDSTKPKKPKKQKKQKDKSSKKKRQKRKSANKGKKKRDKETVTTSKDIAKNRIVKHKKDTELKQTIELRKDSEVKQNDDLVQSIENHQKFEHISLDDVSEDVIENTETPQKTDSINTEQEDSNDNENLEDDNLEDDNLDDSEGWFESKINQIKHWFSDFKGILQSWYQKVINILGQFGKIREFLVLEENKLALGIGYGTLRKIILHLRPQKIKSRLRFGTGDPCTTGQALAIAAVLYGIYGENIQITPDFEQKVFEGYHDIKGRIRIGTLLIIVGKLLLGKEYKGLKDNFKILKEAL